MKRGLLTLVLLALGIVVAAGQPRGPGPSIGPGSAIMVETFPRGQADSARGILDVHFRLDAGFFIAVRDADDASGASYVRRGELLIELIDSTGMTRAREITRLERRTDEATRPHPGTEWFQGGFTFTVPYGTYAMLVEVTDSESQRSTTDRSRRVSLQRPGVDAPETIFIDTPRSHDSTQAARIHNYGGDILFGSAVSLYTELPADSFPGSTVDVAVQFAMISPGDEEEIVLRRDTVAGVRPVRRPRPVRVVDTLGLAYIEGKAAQPVVTTLTVPLKTERLPLRRYRMTAAVTAGDRPLTCVREFRMIWPDMPRSLRNVDEAIAALRYIATETTMDSLMDGPLEVRWARLEGFWKPRDRSPETAPNEVMTEYYRRVDYAREAFGTLRQADGFLTDRGRIYVLHGAPTGTERTLDPAEGFTEVWTYGRTSKTFVFVDRAKTGDYILVQRPPQ